MSWYLKECTSESQAEDNLKNKAPLAFVIWPSPSIKGCLIYSHKKLDKTYSHLKIMKEQNGFKIQEDERHYPTLELLILGLRKTSSSNNLVETPKEIKYAFLKKKLLFIYTNFFTKRNKISSFSFLFQSPFLKN